MSLFLQKLAIFLLRFYQIVISSLLHSLFPGSGCRFQPTCSQHTINSIQKYGIISGINKGFKQFIRCQPFHHS